MTNKVVESIPEPERETSLEDLDFSHALMERALGVQWHVMSDTLCFKIAIKDKPLTRRGILSVISSIYDPLGFVLCLFHVLCHNKLVFKFFLVSYILVHIIIVIAVLHVAIFKSIM